MLDKSELSSFSSKLKQLSTKNRQRVRAMFNLSTKDGAQIFNTIRGDASAWEIYHAENALRDIVFQCYKTPDAFPSEPQVKENYYRLAAMGLVKQAKLIEIHTKNNLNKLLDFCSVIKELNNHAYNKNLTDFDLTIDKLQIEFGYSHFLLRKACWMKSEVSDDTKLPSVDRLLSESGIGEKNLITTSIVNCFSDGHDYLALRKSMLSIAAKGIKGVRNQFTRDMVRQIFLPHAKDEKDLSSLLQSTSQSSLIDAILCFKINRYYLSESGYENCDIISAALENSNPGIDALAQLYLDREDSEGLFFQRTGGWLESNEIIEYRLFNDFFYDPALAESLEQNHYILVKAQEICSIKSISELSSKTKLTNHNFPNLTKLETDGLVSRSSAFNFTLFKNNGDDSIDEDSLLSVMSNTRDLSRTINPSHAKNLIGRLRSRLSKIIIYLLIIKRSRDDLSSNRLTRLLEEEITQNYSASLIEFIEALGKRHESVAIYLHETCTEDFLARLTKIIPETKSITDTRAALHEWRGKKTGNNALIDRARAIRIDYKISLVRGEIDDNRIYVDPSRFLDWISDNIAGELITVLTSINHNLSQDESIDDPQLRDIISRCYQEFCSNKHYGIASYIGRRIRHGTFKGHVFTNVISLEKDYRDLLFDASVADKYQSWRARFEAIVTDAVNEKLHIESNLKKDGLIKPNIKSSAKQEVVSACMADLIKFFSTQGTSSLPTVLLEYCWRMVEIDLLAIRNYINSIKSKVGQNELSTDIRKVWNGPSQVSGAFARDLQQSINKQFKMAQSWFKRPPSVSPKANINLLYKAVIREVQETFSGFNTEADYEEDDDLELFGEVYHRIYDALFVIIFNAAKHGRPGSPLERTFLFDRDRSGRTHLILSISSRIKDGEDETEVSKQLRPNSSEDISNAHLHENRSGIPKLYNLTMADENFAVESIKCSSSKVSIAISYRMTY